MKRGEGVSVRLERVRGRAEAHFWHLGEGELARDMVQEAGEGDEEDGLTCSSRLLVAADELGEEEGEEALLVEQL